MARGVGELQAPQSDSYAEAHAIRNEKRAVLTSGLNIPLVRMPNLSAASSYCARLSETVHPQTRYTRRKKSHQQLEI